MASITFEPASWRREIPSVGTQFCPRSLAPSFPKDAQEPGQFPHLKQMTWNQLSGKDNFVPDSKGNGERGRKRSFVNIPLLSTNPNSELSKAFFFFSPIIHTREREKYTPVFHLQGSDEMLG